MHKISRVGISVLTTAMIGCASDSDIGETSQTFDVDASLQAWVEAWNTLDLVSVDSLFVRDTSVSYFSSEREGLIQGPAALREHHLTMGFVNGGAEPRAELWVEDIESHQFASTAVVTGVWYFGDRSVSRDSTQRGPMTVVYVQTNDGYRIAHMHFAEY